MMNTTKLIKPCALAAAVLLFSLAGCAKHAGKAYVEIENEQTGGAMARAEPIVVDPRVEVVTNQYERIYSKDGAGVRQRIIIRGPVMIVPAASGPGTGSGSSQTQPTIR